jgi:hypothetical protein
MLPPRIYLSIILISVVILSTTSSVLTSSAVVKTRNKNNWDFVNHDIYGTRNSNQTIIGKENVDNLEVKWRLFNDFEIQLHVHPLLLLKLSLLMYPKAPA